MSKELIKAKLKASAIHLGISIVIFLGILYLIFVEWYPGSFFYAEGGWKGLKLMAVVDLVLGPSLTLIIYNYVKSKKEIFVDFSFIALVQIGALIWGGLQVYSERPVALVMWEGMFYTVTEDYYAKQGIDLKDVATYSDDKPLIIYAESDGSVEQLEKTQLLNKQKIPVYAQVHLYKSVKDNIDAVLSYQLSEDYRSAYLAENTSIKNQHFFPAKAKYKDLLVSLDAKAGLLDITFKPVNTVQK